MVIQNHTSPFSSHLIATAIMISETEKTAGRARANLPKWSNKEKSKKAPTGIKTYPHNGKRIRLSSSVITLSLGIFCNRFSCAVSASRPVPFKSDYKHSNRICILSGWSSIRKFCRLGLPEAAADRRGSKLLLYTGVVYTPCKPNIQLAF